VGATLEPSAVCGKVGHAQKVPVGRVAVLATLMLVSCVPKQNLRESTPAGD
jgi:hypothetical protein